MAQVGRPTKYNPLFINKVDEYIETTGKEQTALPSYQGFALYIDCSLDAMESWRKLYPEFNGALNRLKNKQAEQLINDGIYGGKEVNATIVKLLLQNNHGMKERQDLTTDGKELKGFIEVNYGKKDDQPIPVAE